MEISIEARKSTRENDSKLTELDFFKYEGVLEKGEIIHIEKGWNKPTISKITILGNDGKIYFGIFKVEENIDRGIFGFPKESWVNEIISYRISKLLGLGVVPTTVYRKIEGLGRGSLQLFVNFKDGSIDSISPDNNGNKINMFNFIAAMNDSKDSDVLVGPMPRVRRLKVDNEDFGDPHILNLIKRGRSAERSVKNFMEHYGVESKFSILPKPVQIELFKTITKDDIRTSLGEYSSPEIVEFVYLHIRKMINFYNRNNSYTGDH